jgi:outer membrane protein
MKTRLTALLLLTLCLTGYAQTVWTLQQCIDQAQKNNIALKQSELTTQMYKNNETQSKAAILPTVNMGAQHTYNFGRTIDRYTNTFANTQVLSQNFYISSNVVLWSGLAQYNNVKANEYQYLSSSENFLQQRNDLSLNVATAFINVIFCDELLIVAKAQYSITEEQMKRTEKLVDAGTLAKSAYYDLQAQLSNEVVNVTTADNNYQIALLTLQQLMNMDSLSNFSVEKPNIEVLSSEINNISVQGIYEAALKNQHSVRSAEYNVLATEKNLAVAKGRVSPTLSATGTLATGTSGLDKNITGVNFVGLDTTAITTGGQYVLSPRTEVVTEKKPFVDQFKDNANKSFGFTLTVPIFNGLQTYTNVKNARINALNAKYNQDLVEQNLYKTIAQAYANARASLNKYLACKTSVEASEQSFAYAQQKYNVGAISTFDFNTAQTRLQNAQANLVQAKYDYIFRLKVLDFYQGKPLTLN